MLEQKDAVIAEVAGRRHWREAEARVLIDAWRQSGQTLTAFARACDVHPERLARWHRQLRAESPEAVRFHPVRVRTAERDSDEYTGRIELVLGDGRSIRVPHGFDAGDLRRVLAVVEGDV
jgi:hypothetical protein